MSKIVPAEDNKSFEPIRVLNHIGGQRVNPTTNKYLPLINPKDGSSNGEVALSDANDVQLAVDTAKKALVGWSKLTVKARSQYLYKFRSLIIDHQQELAELITREHGKTIGEAIGDVQKGNETVEWACSLPQVIQGKTLEVSGGITCADTREPHGIVASIVPFNFPFMVPMWTLPIAIGCGNVMIIKPSEKVPLTMNRVMDLIKEAGFPDGVVQIVNGQAPVVNAICDHPDIKAVSFVGSSKVAELVSHRCRLLNKRVLALGAAKNHLVALPDCNIDMCSSDIVASFTGCTGQRCMAASALILVTEQKQLLDSIVAKATKLVPGQETGKIGPLIDDIALTRVHKYINEAEASGAKILLDGRGWSKDNPKGNWVGPTIILHNSANEPAFTDEIFGPVLSVVVVDSKEKAVEIENKSPYGNAASIYTTVGAHAEYFVSRFHTGHVGVNIGVPVPREPFSFGGWNASKYGDMDITGDGGMEFFTKRKKITTKWNPPQNKGLGDWMA